MAVASLSKFTVPLSNNQSADSQGLLMPKLKYRFRASFTNFGVTNQTNELTKQIVDIKRPNVTFPVQTIDVYNSKVYLQGKPEWQETTINLRDDASGAVSKIVGEQIQKQFDFLEQSSAASGINYKFLTVFEVLDGGNGTSTPNVLETWVCYGCYLVSTNYQGLDYKAQEAVVLDLSIQYDNAVQTTGGTLGAPTPVMTPGAATSQNVMGS